MVGKDEKGKKLSVKKVGVKKPKHSNLLARLKQADYKARKSIKRPWGTSIGSLGISKSLNPS